MRPPFAIQRTKSTCLSCRREVDTVVASDVPGVRLSRHFKPVAGFCLGSLVELPRRP